MSTSDKTEPLSRKFIEWTVQTLIYGAMLALLGFWLNLRLESYKSDLANNTEKLKTVLQLDAPLIQQRMNSYYELKKATRNLGAELQSYYEQVNDSPGDKTSQMESLAEAMGVRRGTGGGSGGGWTTPDFVVRALEDVVRWRSKNDDVASDEVKASVDNLIDVVIPDLRQYQQPKNRTKLFENLAWSNANKALDKLLNEINHGLEPEQLAK